MKSTVSANALLSWGRERPDQRCTPPIAQDRAPFGQGIKEHEEGIAKAGLGDPDPLQQAFIDETAFQCGFCAPGTIMSAKGLLRENPFPAEEEVNEALSGNFCRCISHYQVMRVVMAASRKTR